MSSEGAIEIAGLSQEEMEKIKKVSLKITSIVTEKAKEVGLFNEDGKFEFGFDEKRNLILVDALGTLDEYRFTYEGIPISKEIARIYYRKTDWFKGLEEAKRIDKVNWKSIVKSVPSPLPPDLAEAISLIYQAYANEITGREWFKTLPLRNLLERVKNYI